MKNTQRFRNAFQGRPVDRLPLYDWTDWWEVTLDRWFGEGLPRLSNDIEIREYLGLDVHVQIWVRPRSENCTEVGFGEPRIRSAEDYNDMRRNGLFYPDPFQLEETLEPYLERHENGELVVWMTLDGFFWHPRQIFGIEQHLTAFYDHPELMHDMNKHALEYHLKVIDKFCEICLPDHMTFAEDMSYNHGPMISRAQFDEFLAPYYLELIPELKKRGITAIVDTDGDVTEPVDWYVDVGIDGIEPLERMAGTDVAAIRKKHPELIMIGAYDKRVMSKGETAIRDEFERLLPVILTGRFIPTVDHQVPPDVSLSDYRMFVDIYREYAEKSARGKTNQEIRECV